ncbi:MAG: hypothetical protein M1823_002795 [Watsoniomyces obsoletus]|nr:MAG: hypothetical protein M1823_002795 [Watsoniomyces obsoletus]
MEETNENANGNGNGNGNVKVEDMDENENGRLEGMENVKLELMDHAHSDVDVKLEPMEMEMEKVKTEEGWEIVGGGTLEELEMKDMDIHGGLVLPEGLTREWFERRMVLAGYLGLGIQGRGWDEEEKKENGIGNGEVVREEKEKEIKKEKVIIMLDD